MPQLLDQSQAAPQEAASFYSQPILNSPYEEPSRYWELDEAGLPISSRQFQGHTRGARASC